ncbi:MAG TPA: AMP-binding protein, partial [Candidatus Polarisedimenticolia bacterium]|nr:AMP-binding protein [Candidatus Polarisedimenticolia bacterium]
MKTSVLRTQWQQLPEQVVRQLQAEKLRHYLRSIVLPFSAHYRELFRQNNLDAESFRSLEDLQCVPFTSKADLLNTPENPRKIREFILVPDAQELAHRPSTIFQAALHGRACVTRGFEHEFRPVFMTCTTGRSAESVAFTYSNYDLANLAQAGKRIFEICKAEPDFRLLNTFPYAPHLAFWLAHYGGMEFNNFVLSSGGGKVLGTDGQLRFIRQLQPHVLIGMPTFLYHVLQQAVEEGVKCPNLCRIVLGGEKVAPGTRRRLARLARELGAETIDVVATYGFTEAKMAWTECPCADGEQTGYHLYPDLGIIEIVDPKTGAIMPPGEGGEIVFTPLDSRGSVVLRYRTGDLIDGGLVHEPCPHCHRIVPRLVGNISRTSEIKTMRFDKIKGTLVDFNILEHVLDDSQHLDSWQLELRKHNDDPMELDELILHVHKTDSLDEARCAREL